MWSAKWRSNERRSRITIFAGATVLISVVVPCYNEEEVICATHTRLLNVFSTLLPEYDLELVYVNDGSGDETLALLRRLQSDDRRVRIISFSRNFGHQLAVTAGVDHASGDAVVLIDADLQDPPEVIADMVARWQDGYDVAYGVRTDRVGESAFKLWTAKLFYRGINRLSSTPIPLDTGDFRLMDRKVVDALRAMPERDRFVRGMVSWVGFKQVAVPYRRAARFAGETKYPVARMLRFAIDGVTSFSVTPLKIATWMGFAASMIALIGVMYAFVIRLFTREWVSGWAALFVAVLFVGGVQLVAIGIIGEYVGRIYGEVKRRPLYVIGERHGFAQAGVHAIEHRMESTREPAAMAASAGPRLEPRQEFATIAVRTPTIAAR
jgi:polyisoprenyl-phosphate glycosyltransferase